ncbi:class I mannose-6-phosphate isomerase [Pararhodonellum marinum]|uniref:class I mannose-6-phosphate isomerase n=1 Tax=Pararhodonellum marinum TaxID=2755358 RepID=UPI001E5041B1|nr:class I mannose-6-phosphate isomerase [Pararhodonellum marinum]
MKKSNYDKYPFIQIEENNHSCCEGWEEVLKTIGGKLDLLDKRLKILVIECYQGVDDNELRNKFQIGISHTFWIESTCAFLPENNIHKMVSPDVTEDRVFGYMTDLCLEDYFDKAKISQFQDSIKGTNEGTIIIYGPGASLLAPHHDVLVYADMPRWEIQMRMRRKEVNSLGLRNKCEDFSHLYKHGFFVDWRVLDRHKKTLINQWDFLLDSTIRLKPKLVKGKALLKALEKVTRQPFRVVPFFDPGPWGGQWMKEVYDLDRSEINYAWGFDCVPEENSLLLGFGEIKIEIPAINLVFNQPKALLGQKVYARFGDEFPIRFDFLDTMDGGNLSLQVHPLTEYIQQTFGMNYTQDESYYMLDVAEDAFVYLGLKDDVCPDKMIQELKEAQNTGVFHADRHVKKWPVKKHDHVSIPAGTVHCSGIGSMVLEISATPYIFTFKLWDWGRLGLDGKPRPINIEHGEKVIQWDRTATWVEKNALNLVEPLASGPGWSEERTGLNELEFIETRRHWFKNIVNHDTNGTVNVLNLVQGEEAIVESPNGDFEPFVVHYAETFIIPASVGTYTIRPYGNALGSTCATIKAYVRT